MRTTGRTKMGIYPSTHKTLLERLQSGDDVSWQEFYQRYSPVILQICMESGISKSESQDVLQNVMLKFFRHDLAMKYDSKKARFRTYFNQVVHSCITDFQRKIKQEVPKENIPEASIPPESDELFLNEWRKQMIQEALDRLRNQVKPENFLAFHLTVFQGKSIKEAAEFLKTDPDAIYVARSRCTAQLKKIIEEINRDDSALNLKWEPRA